ncbi:LOW QUALITY PROTEIN: hypothetical protein Cgig2_024549 [Carnegiea gigantea]|uniref:Uncharacterized protein n=1 Tax=Carnegiea gigantea TaxID=171969 RepID=A0A9Q1JTD4_9CARY|nr:LOW QUALITY PROTEIN: hypothetical protein Cgig2_024549 [Carnegiea gigantea]
MSYWTLMLGLYAEKLNVEENEYDDAEEAEISIVRAHTERGRVIVTCVTDNPASDGDSHDKDFTGDGEEIEDVNDSEDISLDEETKNGDSRDDDQLEVEVDQRMQLGTEIIDSDADRELVVNKMARDPGKEHDKGRYFTFLSLIFCLGNYKGLEKCYAYCFKETIYYYKNFSSLDSGAWLHAFFYIAANAYAPCVHEKAVEKIREKDPTAYHWLRDNKKLELFEFDTNLKCDDNTNNFVKRFNHVIMKLRGLPILTILEEIRKLIGNRFVNRFEKSQKWNGKLVPYVHKKLIRTEMESRNYTHLVYVGQGEFDVTEGHTNFTVRFYDCKKWQFTGLPYKHITRCIFKMKQQLDDYVEGCFTVEKYRNLHNHIVQPIAAP